METKTLLRGVRGLRVERVVLAVWLSTLVAVVWPATLSTDNVKLTPITIQNQSSPSLPPEVQTLESQTAPAAFDRDTTSEHTAFDGGHLVAVLDAPIEIRTIKIYGAAPYSVSVEADVNGAWQAIAGLQNINLATRPDGWNAFAPSGVVTTGKLRFTLASASGSAAAGLKGIEIWGKGGRVNIKNGAALLSALLGTAPPTHARIYRSSLAQGVIGAVAGGTDNLSDNTFAVTLDRNPADFKRVYLSYQVLGLSSWVHAVRAINGKPGQGGFVLPSLASWAQQIEEINPQWLAQGANSIAFSTPAGSTGTFTVKDVFLIAELESGANFISSIADNQPDPTNPEQNALDGDTSTGWTPYPGGAAVKADIPTLTLNFDKRTQIEGVALYLVGNLKGSIDVQYLKDGVWSPSGAPTVLGSKLATGWNSITAPSAGGVDGVQLVFSGGKGSNADVKEVVVSGSGTGAVFNPPRIGVSYPDAGQFYARTAYIRGFLQPLDNGSGAAALTVGGKPVTTSDGAFGVVITKDDLGLTTQGDSETWTVEVKAVYPNGQTIVTTVTLNNWQPAVESTAANLLPSFNAALPAGQAKKMSYDAATLDMPAGSTTYDVTVGMTPLSDLDLPALDPGMTNVTKGPRRGYRFTPHPMKFAQKVKVTLPYSQGLIPPGQTEQDIKTFYFDDQSGTWKELERAAIDPQGNTITSLTDHFTDMINATVTVPDHPNLANFNPTQIKDIKAADPGAQVNLIEAPKANNQGDARLSYPIDVPPGRQGMQPQLAVQYSSAGGNGWMGMGWDVPMQAVTIDTRFGVPRYDSGLETETYMFSGEMLTPVAHRGDLRARSDGTTVINGETVKVFHARVEGQFKRIIRKGTTPSTYTWEVTDKNGVRYLYGATDPVTETLTDAGGNRFLWALCQIIDPNGNFVRYHYAKVSDSGVPGGIVPGSNIYLQSITYTGSGLTEGPYAVNFFRDRDLNEVRRPDVQIDARGGFKRVTADLLRRVEVTLSNQLIRRYEFRYNENPYGDNRPGTAFNKTLLTSIGQFGADGIVFNRHTFLYNDEARDAAGTYRGFAGSTDWGVGSDGIGIGLLGQGTASALGGSQSISAGGHLYVGVGTGVQVASKELTAGVKVGFSQSRSETLITMADLNGDGLPDKVFKDGGGFFYRPNQSGPNGATTFGERVSLPTLPAISRDRVTSTTVGGEIYLVLPIMLDFNRATNQSDTYFSDVNGDGLTDLVSGGQVLFGFINAAGVPTFSANSADTPVPVGTGAIITTNLLEDAAAIEAERAQQFPLLDTLRRWVAPYDGTIMINAPVRLIQDTSPERAAYTGADGVRVAIQLEGSELWFTTIGPNDFDPKTPTGVTAVPVLRGQRLYFRVQSVFDGAFDQVAWDPQISYTQIGGTPADPTRTDVNDLAEFRYQASGDFTLAGRGASTVTVPLTGSLHLAGRFEKGPTTDDVKLVITKNGMNVFTRNFGFAETAVLDISQDVPVTALDVLQWQILIDSPIDATKVKLTPDAYYTAADGVDRVTDDQGNFVIRVSPPYDMDLYVVSSATTPQGFFTVPTTGTFTAQARLQTTLNAGETTTAVFTVKRRGTLLAKTPISITGTGTSSETIVTADFTANAGEQVFFDVSSRDPFFATRLTLLEVTVNGSVVPSASHTRQPEGLFPQAYRGWGAAGYNGNPPRDALPIDQALLVIDATTTTDNLRAYPFFPRPMDALWGGVDDQAYVKAGSMSSSRVGLDDIRMPTSAQFAGQSAPARISLSTNIAVAAGFGASAGDSQSKLEFQDLNGDRFPDVISSSGGVQFSRAAGGLEDQRRGSGTGSARKSSNENFNASTSGAGNIARAIASARGNNAPDGVKPANQADNGSDMSRLGFGGDVGFGNSQTEFDLVDVNGDGLLDKVFRNGSVQLNFGYTFAPAAEGWGGGIVNNGQTLNAGVNLGFNLNFYSIAGGLNLGVGETRSDETYADINGDGLPDKILAGSPLTVRLNTGSGFTGPITWPGGQGKVAVDKNITLGGGVFFTFGFTFLGAVKVVVNPGVSLSTSLGRPEVAFRDMDGDGFADHVFSTRDSQLSVALNQIGRTNLLKKVHRPLGATFDLEYTRDGNRFDLPQSRWLMTKVTMFDGHVGEGADRQITTYGYTGSNYSRLEREFFGYSTVIERHLDTLAGNAPFRTIQRDYLTTNYYTKGLLSRTLTSDAAARPFLEAQNTYVLRDVALGVEPVDGTSTTATIFPQLTRADRRFFEGGIAAQKATATLQQYDALGNVSLFADTADVGAADDAVATISYTSSDPTCQASYIVGKPNKIVVTGNGATMRNREATIDCRTGDATQIREFLGTGQVAVTDLTYSQTGNLLSVTGPANRNAQRYRLDYLYETTVDTHIARATDSFGLFSTSDYDLRFGRPTTKTDINGQKTTYAYDSVGREDTIVGPYEQGTGQFTIDFDYAPVQTPASDTSGNTIPLAQVPFAFTKHIDKDADGVLRSTGTIDTVLFTDGLKRIIQTKKDAAVHVGPDATSSDVITVSGQVVFDAFGRSVTQFYPITEPKGSNTQFNPSVDTVAPTTMTYDVLDRNIRTTLPDGSLTTLTYGFGADRAGLTQFLTSITDANGKVRQTYRDVRELVTTVKEFNQGSTLQTSYAYDPLRQIVQVVDDRNNTTNIAYDNLGRRTVIDNPDAGRSETQYDLASNFIAKITANLRSAAQQISYNYEFNRLTGITYPNFPGNNITYTYGAPSAAGSANGNRAGRVATVSSQMGTEDRFYGPLGEVTKEVKTIVTFTTPNAPEVYTALYQYDTWNRLMRMTYPDGEVLTYAYDSGGLVNFAQGKKNNFTYSYINRLEYDKFEQRAFVEAGNNVRTRYAYDAQTRHLCALTSAKGTGGTPTCVTSLSGTLPVQNNIQNLLYVYDKVGNILGEANSIPVPPPSQFGGPTKQTFVYDDLYRLTQASGTFNFNPSKTQTYSMVMAYDSIHNIVSKNQSDVITQPSGTPIAQKKTSYLFNYAYGSPHPHAPTHIGNRTFSYDANGNQLGWDNDDNGTRRTIVWDEENRIQSLFDNGHEKTYKYDDQGQRIIKRGPQGETVYVNQYFTIRNKQIGTKHVFAGTARMVSKLMKQDKPGANPQGNTPVEKDLFFFHPDHLGSSHYITDTQGQIFEHLEYFPFGEAWVEESTNTQRTPYLFTSKEFDEETGLYYFGARYYDPRTSVWQNTDPGFGDSIPNLTHSNGALRPERPNELPANGVYASQNLALYSYGHQNPVKLVDPDGKVPFLAITGGIGVVVGGAAGAYISYRQTGSVSWKAVAGGAVAGGLVGLGSGAGLAYFATGTATATTGEVVLGARLAATVLTGAGGAAGERISGPLGQVARSVLERAAASSGPTTTVFTRLTQAPATDRALSVATGEGAQALANAARAGGTLFRGNIPTQLISELEAAGLVTRSTTLMGGVQATELRFAPQAAEFIARFFTAVP